MFTLSVRREYAYRVEGRAPKCQPCRRPAVRMTEAERESYRQWWLEESGLSPQALERLARDFAGTS